MQLPVRRPRRGGLTRGLTLASTVALLSGLFSVPLLTALTAEPAAAAANAVVPDSAIAGFTPDPVCRQRRWHLPVRRSGTGRPRARAAKRARRLSRLGSTSIFTGRSTAGSTSTTTATSPSTNRCRPTRPVGIGANQLRDHRSVLRRRRHPGRQHRRVRYRHSQRPQRIRRQLARRGLLSGERHRHQQLPAHPDRPRPTGPPVPSATISISSSTMTPSSGMRARPAEAIRTARTPLPSNSAVVGFSNGTSTPGDTFQLPGSQTTGRLSLIPIPAPG